jgi:hypothetical protein
VNILTEVHEFRSWLEADPPASLPGGGLGRAIAYGVIQVRVKLITY